VTGVGNAADVFTHEPPHGGRHVGSGVVVAAREGWAYEQQTNGQRAPAPPLSFPFTTTPFSVASQPVRMFPPPPPSHTVSTPRYWSEAAPSSCSPAQVHFGYTPHHAGPSLTVGAADTTTNAPRTSGVPTVVGRNVLYEGVPFQPLYTAGCPASSAAYGGVCDESSGDVVPGHVPHTSWDAVGWRSSTGVFRAAHPADACRPDLYGPFPGPPRPAPRTATTSALYEGDAGEQRTAFLGGAADSSGFAAAPAATPPFPDINTCLNEASPEYFTLNAAPHPLNRHDRPSPSTPPPPPLSISDGAYHLNVVRHRSAAAAGAALFHSSGPSPTSTLGSGVAASRHERARRGLRGRLLDATDDGPTHSPLSSATSASAAAAVGPAESCCVAAVVFNSAKEVGVALCELPSLTISLLQYADTASFFKTTSLLHARNPVEVLVPATVVDTEFVQILLQQHSTHMTFTSVQRCFYHAEAGVQRLSQLKSSQEAALCIEDTDRYLCVAAANALVLYMEHVNDMQLLPGSVRVRAEVLEHFAEISRTTARALQIVSDGIISSSGGGNRVGGGGRGLGVVSGAATPPLLPETQSRLERRQRRRPRSTCATATAGSTWPGFDVSGGMTATTSTTNTTTTLRAVALVDAIPRACTVMGQRYLRRTLLQPLRDRVAVQGRHDTVEWLLREPRRLHTLRALLRHTAALDLERLTASLTLQPRQPRTEAQTHAFLASLLLLWSALPYLQQLHTQLREYLGALSEEVRASALPAHAAFASPSASFTATTEEQEIPPEASSKGQEGVPATTATSTPAYPLVLHSVATTLQQCRFAELSALMGCYLERSVLPTVVEDHTRGHLQRTQECASPKGPSHHPTNESARYEQGYGVGGVSRRSRARQRTAAATTLLRVLRMCFLVQAPRGGELDALRTRLSQRIAGITTYADELRQQYQLHTLRLEPDPVKLYCFSYLSAEEAKARVAPFTWRYAGGSHFALYLAALRAQQQQEQQQPQQQTSFKRTFLCSDGGATEELHESSRRSRCGSASHSSTSSSPRRESDRQLASEHCQDGRAGWGAASMQGNASFSLHQQHRSEALPSFSVLTPSWDGAARARQAEGRTATSVAWDVPGSSDAASSDRRRRHRRVRCSTEELEYRCTRTQECVTAILAQQMSAVQPLVLAVRRDFLGALQATVESVALLDMLLSFALYSLTHRCTRPVMVELQTGLTTASPLVDAALTSGEVGEGKGDTSQSSLSAPQAPEQRVAALATSASGVPLTTTAATDDHGSTTKAVIPRAAFFLHGAFHPTVGVAVAASAANPSALSQAGSLCSFSCTACTPARDAVAQQTGLNLSWGTQGEVCIITGPNACGKTTLLRIIGQHITLAQAGCFVPAREAQLFLADRLLVHMLCDELPSVLQSSFKRELMELNELTHAATAESVVLMDELGRSTTTAQGFSLAWATGLFLSNHHVHAVLTTHFAGLPSLTRVRPGRVVAYHFRVAFASSNGGTRPGPRLRGTAVEEEDRENAGCAALSRAEERCTETFTPSAGPRVTIVRFGHELFSGACPQRWYGLAMAERLHFFEPVLALARHTRACCLATHHEAGTALDTGDDGCEL
jgi:DNA mismatch repair ATPase MutS